jgi:hypothetical protein
MVLYGLDILLLVNISKMSSLSVSDTLSAICNDKSLTLFNTIALASGNADILITRLKITRKQYYSRMFELTNAGLIRRKNGKHFLTSFGRIVYAAQELIGKAIQYSSKLQAIDSIGTSEFPAAERIKIIDTLIHNSEIKEILIDPQHNNNHITAEKEKAYNNELVVSSLTKR